MRFGRQSALIGIAVGLGGCSLLYWPSKDDLVGNDASSSGGVVSKDGAIDGVAATDGATDGPATLTCPTGALFCDDFERATVKGAFTDVIGATSISTTHAHSPSRSLSAIVKNGVSKTGLEVELDVPSRVVLSLWFYAPDPPSEKSINVRIASLLMGDACDWDLAWTLDLNTDYGLRITENAYDAKVNGSCGPIANDGQVLLTPNQVFVAQWHHVVVTLDTSSPNRRVSGTVDDRPALGGQVASQRETVPKTATLSIGIPCTQTNSGCFDWGGSDYEVFFDDVVLTTSP